jgi:uncharacterized protein (TIGR03435 family)
MVRISLLTAALASTVIYAQQPAFEVATLRRSPPAQGDSIDINLGNIRNGRLTLTNSSLSDCVKFAWGLVSDAQLAGPDWIRTKAIRFDVVAEVAADTTREQALLMLQTLLAQRLKLAVHHEQRELPYLALVAGKTGPKFREGPPDAPPGGTQVSGHISSRRMSIPQLSLLLSRFERQTVLDRTGLKGSFDITLDWTPENNADLASGPTIFTAVQEQLGLKLEARKGPVDVLVVDSAEKVPVGN